MPLKRFQERVVLECRQFLQELPRQQAARAGHPALDAWQAVAKQRPLPRRYHERQTGHGRDLPHVCVRVPTGGGKTLLGTQILGAAYETVLRHRNGAGLVLWVVPSDQIYRDTLKAFQDRRHFYRESLEYALSRRLEVWQKHEIAKLTPAQLASNLNVLLLKLQGTNREDKESLKFFRDSGGNIVLHFPPEDEPERHKQLLGRTPNLDMLAADEASGAFLAKTSLANLVRLCEPVVILDEGHKATSALAQQTIEGFNPSLVVELSATPPPETNVLTTVTGSELLAEEMIKLPINVAASGVTSWQRCLEQAHDRRKHLAGLARKHYEASGRLIRPIVLVQVERTGRDQRDAQLVHSDDAKEYLIEKLGVAEQAIAIKTSQRNDIEELDLLDDGCPVEWIITKAALQEGWDCPFAYILVSLNNTTNARTMTQLVGRVLRQPFITRTPFEELNESYIYCRHQTSSAIARDVKRALEKEGYEGEAASVVDQGQGPRGTGTRTRQIRAAFRRYYQQFEGKIYLPRFCVKVGTRDYESLDWYRHLLAAVDPAQFDYASIDDWDLNTDLAAAREYFYRIQLGGDDPQFVRDAAVLSCEPDDRVQGWLIANLSFEYYGFRERSRIVAEPLRRLLSRAPQLAGQLNLVKAPLRERLTGLVERETERATEAAFRSLFDNQKLCFYLECVECRFEIPDGVEVRAMKQLQHDNGNAVERSLFDFVPDDLNSYERSVALFLDSHPQVLWWYRNLVGPGNFAVQGFRRSPIYPDFVIQEGEEQRASARVLVLESKGSHLKGNEDTKYKRRVADLFEQAGQAVPWQKLGEEFANNQFRFQILDEGDYADRDWRQELKHLLDRSP